MIKRTVVLLLFSVTTAFAQDATSYVELPRFQQVSERLYRSGQPPAGAMSRLRELGINTVINLRGAGEQTRVEETEARAAGLNYFNVALPSWARPQDARVERILEIIAAPESGRVLVHCKDGVDRTGMIVAIYRMKQEGWTTSAALAEADRDGMRRMQFWMRDYAEDYGRRLHTQQQQTGLKSPHVGDNFEDRVGASMRVVEKGAFRARKCAGRFLRKFSTSFR